MKVLLAGGTGFIGRAVLAALLDAGDEVIVVSRSTPATIPNVQHVAADVTSALDPDRFPTDIDAIVNLVGIAVQSGSNTFERAHVDAVEHLLTLATALDVARFVHVSVVRVEAAEAGSAYHRTKRQGEARVIASDRDWTLLRPGLVYGPGDAMMSNLVGFIAAAPVFAVPGGPPGALQVVDVDDVATSVVRTLQRPRTIGAALDIVGPERLELAGLVRRTSSALGLWTAVLPLPRTVMRIAAGILQRVLAQPPVTPTQLDMLVHGLFGDPEPARELLDLTPRPLTAERIGALAARVEDGPPSVRLAPSPEHRAELTRWSVPLWFVALAIVALLVGPWLISDVWLRMLALNAVLGTTALLVGTPWRRWLGASRSHVGIGLAAAAVMIAGASGVIAVLRSVAPGWMEDTATIYAWAHRWPGAATAAMLVVIAAGEDLVWRFAITLGLVRRFGPGLAMVVGGVAFAVAHWTTGPPVLALAALIAGLAWSALAIRTRSWLAVTLCHVLWDAALVGLAP